MDKVRTGVTRRRWTRRFLVFAALASAASVSGYYLSELRPAAPTVERSALWTDTARRGEIVRQVRALGTLVPEESLLVPALTDGRVARILVRPGSYVQPSTVIAVLTNPELELAALDAEYQVKAAKARFRDLKVQLERQLLSQRADSARISSEYQQAKLRADKDEQLHSFGLGSELTSKLSQAAADELANRSKLEQERLNINPEAVEAQLAVQSAEIDKLQALHSLKVSQVGALQVLAGTPGVVQQVPVEVGQQLAAGTILAKIAHASHLKAELRVPETQAKDIRVGQSVTIDTHNGKIDGTVFRIDPAVQQGTVTVDVSLLGKLPEGARPDLSVEGIVELEKLSHVLFVKRPTFGQPNASATLFKLTASGAEADRVQVRFGRTSANSIEVVAGLQEGDTVILSEMGDWEKYNKIRLK